MPKRRKSKVENTPETPQISILLDRNAALVATHAIDITPTQCDGGNLSGWSAIGGRATQPPPSPPANEPYGRYTLHCTGQVVSNETDVLSAVGNGANTLVLISCDLHSCSQPLHAGVTEHLNARYCIPPSNVILSGTHTHSGPGRYYGNKLYDAMTVSTHNLMFGFDASIFNRLLTKIQECADEAISKLSNGTFAITRTSGALISLCLAGCQISPPNPPLPRSQSMDTPRTAPSLPTKTTRSTPPGLPPPTLPPAMHQSPPPFQPRTFTLTPVSPPSLLSATRLHRSLV